ncbi:hypothetical protein J4449_00500 [Candidatus Woesearchaeota archaeon]|nr:hypothetical protein [Candidatus Woesearchaeota archaeon]
MILFKFLGFLDIVSALVILVLKFGFFVDLGILLSIYLAIKSIIFIKDAASIIDLVTAVFFFLAAFGYYFSFTWIFAIWLLQKGLFTLIYN